MAMSDREIEAALQKKELRITPPPSKVNPAGIDLRAHKKIILPPKSQKLAATLERVELSARILGILHIRSSFAREGIIASLALVDPGFKGQLTISLYNAGESRVNVRESERFVQLTLFRLRSPSRQSYRGRYQNSLGIVKSRR